MGIFDKICDKIVDICDDVCDELEYERCLIEYEDDPRDALRYALSINDATSKSKAKAQAIHEIFRLRKQKIKKLKDQPTLMLSYLEKIWETPEAYDTYREIKEAASCLYDEEDGEIINLYLNSIIDTLSCEHPFCVSIQAGLQEDYHSDMYSYQDLLPIADCAIFMEDGETIAGSCSNNYDIYQVLCACNELENRKNEIVCFFDKDYWALLDNNEFLKTAEDLENGFAVIARYGEDFQEKEHKNLISIIHNELLMNRKYLINDYIENMYSGAIEQLENLSNIKLEYFIKTETNVILNAIAREIYEERI